LIKKRFHEVSSANQHPYLLKSQYGKVSHKPDLASKQEDESVSPFFSEAFSGVICPRFSRVDRKNGKNGSIPDIRPSGRRTYSPLQNNLMMNKTAISSLWFVPISGLPTIV
jgi:hypothetical protein